MNRRRINRHYKVKNTFNRSQICFRCFKKGHTRGRDCASNDPFVACGRCFRLNYFTVDCICNENHNQKDFSDGMTLRLSDGRKPRPYIDIILGNTTCPALIDTGIFKAKINLEALSIINRIRYDKGLTMLNYPSIVKFPIRRRQKEVMLSFDIRPQQKPIIIIGMEFLMKVGFSFCIDSVEINQRSPITSTPTITDFLYNHIQGRELKEWIEASNKPMYHSYEPGLNPILQEEPRISIENNYYNIDNGNYMDVPDEEDDILDLHPDDEDLEILQN